MSGPSNDDEQARPAGGRAELTHAPDGQRDPPADSSLILDELRALHARLDELERRVVPREDTGPGQRPGSAQEVIPAWRRPTQGEAR